MAQLLTALGEWETSCLPTVPVDGRVAFMQLWKEGQYVNVGETMFVVVPDGESGFVGKALLPMQGSGKVRIGQRAVIRLSGFSKQEYEGLGGDVVSISPVPNEDGNYVVEISLTRMPDRQPPVLKVMNGTAEIVIREQSLLERLFRH